MEPDKLGSCNLCGALYITGQFDYCYDCRKEIELDYQKVNEFLKRPENRMASLEEVAVFTGVSPKRLSEFIKEGRIYSADYPNLGYPCARCGTMIKRQMLCSPCFRDFQEEAAKAIETTEEPGAGNAADDSASRSYWKMKK